MDGEGDLQQVVIGFFGPHQHGKSWTAGTILYESSGVAPTQVKNYKTTCVETLGRPESDWPVLIFDWTKEERQWGRSIRGDKFRFLPSTGDHNCEFFVLDAPGFGQYKSSMARNASQVDIPVIVIWPEKFEEAIPELIDTLHLLLGVSIAEGIIIFFSRTDYCHVSPERFEELETKIRQIVEAHTNLKIYRFCTDTKHLTGTFSEIGLEVHKSLAPKRYPDSDEFIFPIFQDFKIFGFGTVVCGRPVSGRAKANSQPLFVTPTRYDPKKIVSIKTIEVGHRAQTETKSNFVGINVKNLNSNEMTTRAILTNVNESLLRRTCIAKVKFVYSRQLFQHKITILQGYTAKFLNVARSKATLQIENSVKLKKKGQEAIIHLRLNRPTALTTYTKNQHLGKFIIVDHCHVIGIGKVIGVDTFNFLDSLFVWFMGMTKDENSKFHHQGVPADILLYIFYFVFHARSGPGEDSAGGKKKLTPGSPKKTKRKRATLP